MLIVLVITGVAQWIMNICNNYITYHVVQDIRKDAMDRIQIVPLKYLDGHAAGDIVSRVIADADQFADGLLMGFTQAFTGVMTIIGTLGFMLWINGWTGLHLSLFLLRRCPFLWRALLQRNPTACSSSSPRREVSRPR